MKRKGIEDVVCDLTSFLRLMPGVLIVIFDSEIRGTAYLHDYGGLIWGGLTE
jgi:hypothetical protein